MKRVVGLAIGLLGIGLAGCSSQAAPRNSTSVLLEAETKVKVDDQGSSQVDGTSAPEAPAADKK